MHLLELILFWYKVIPVRTFVSVTWKNAVASKHELKLMHAVCEDRVKFIFNLGARCSLVVSIVFRLILAVQEVTFVSARIVTMKVSLIH
jgi:hypothetical protein